MTQPPPWQRTQAGVAFLDEARKRRKRGSPPPDLPELVEQQQLEPDGRDPSGYAVDLAAELLDTNPEAPADNADEILAQHEATSETPSSPAALDGRRDDAPADEILRALEAHHQRTEPHQRHPAPRGSADLDAQQPQRQRTKAAKSREPLLAQRRLLGAGGIAIVVMAAAMATAGALIVSLTGGTSYKLAHTPLARLAPVVKPPKPWVAYSAKPHPTARHVARPHPTKPATPPPSGSSVTASVSSSSEPTTSAPAQPVYHSQPAAAAASSDSGSSSSSGSASTSSGQRAGPTSVIGIGTSPSG